MEIQKIFTFIGIVLGSAFVSLGTLAFEMPFMGESYIYGPSYQETKTALDQLAMDHPGLTRIEIYGKSLHGRDLYAFIIEDEDYVDLSGRKAVLITGAMHGNEYLNIADRLPQWFVENSTTSPAVRRYLEAGHKIIIVPHSNPDAYEARVRRNANNVDINRDYKDHRLNIDGFTQPESRTLSEFVESETRGDDTTLEINLDYHCCVGVWLYPWGNLKRQPSDADYILEHQALLNKVLPSFPGYGYGTYYDILNYEVWGTTTDYYFAEYGALSFIFEGVRAKEDENFPAHTEMWEIFFGHLTD